MAEQNRENSFQPPSQEELEAKVDLDLVELQPFIENTIDALLHTTEREDIAKIVWAIARLSLIQGMLTKKSENIEEMSRILKRLEEND